MNKPKGSLGGECNRGVCNKLAIHKHSYNECYYCHSCALRINQECGINIVKIEKLYYKVVLQKDNGHYSSIIPGVELEYRVGKPTVPEIENSKLFCFDSLHNAENFRDENIALHIFSCEIKNPSKPPAKIAVPTARNILRYWGNDFDTYGNKNTITGTVFCDEITLLEKVS